jgi:hypothetical protein
MRVRQRGDSEREVWAGPTLAQVVGAWPGPSVWLAHVRVFNASLAGYKHSFASQPAWDRIVKACTVDATGLLRLVWSYCSGRHARKKDGTIPAPGLVPLSAAMCLVVFGRTSKSISTGMSENLLASDLPFSHEYRLSYRYPGGAP